MDMPVLIGAQFLTVHPENRDPTTNAAYANNFLRPYMGYGDILEYEFAGTSSYNSLQSTLATRVKGGLEIRGAYTWAKALGTANSDTASVTPFFAPRDWNYGRLSFSRDHVFTMTPTWRVPKSWLPANRVLRAPVQGWEFYFTAQISTGQPYRPGFSTVDGQNFSGTPSQTAQMTWLGGTEFGRPGPVRTAGSIETTYWGNAGQGILTRPGINNWDVRVTRRFNLFSDGKRSLELRGEAYNMVNATQFSNIDTTARFDATGAQINALFLEPNAARRPRFIQMGVKVNW